MATCRELIARRRLQMDLVDVVIILGGERIVFYYLAEKRVDFRELVKDLARAFRARIEMRQIGVRDEAKLLADYGDCGKPVCCNTHLSRMPPVSMRMAKLQKELARAKKEEPKPAPKVQSPEELIVEAYLRTVGRLQPVNVSRLAAKPHVTAGCGGFVDITARARKIVFSGYFTAGAKLHVDDGRLHIGAEGKVKKLVPEVEHVSFSGRRGIAQGQEVSYVTERCVMRLRPEGVTVTELAPGVDLERDVLAQAAFPLLVADDLRTMPDVLFRPEPMGLRLEVSAHV